MKSIIRFGRKEKLSPCFVGPFEVLGRVGTLAYKVALTPSLSKIHNVFHVSTLRKYIYDPSHVVELEPIQISEDLTYEEVPIQIVDVMDKVKSRFSRIIFLPSFQGLLLSYKIIVWVMLHFKSSSLRCEMIVMPLEWVLGRDRVVSEPIPDPGVGTHFKVVRVPLGSKRTISTRLGTGHYKWYQSRSPTPVWGFVWPPVRAPLGLKRTISTWLGAGRYKWYQSRSPTLVWGFVWPRKGCLSIWSHNPVGHNDDVVFAWGVFVTSHIG
uniref:Tf2-1-like SH3-like domain-containing protein n=1 Tax=Vitis vinifera TaxID=29760 RepID=A5BQS9_VITVI|nr:hypothetical protein VITISV_001324 [Vitis vinifera]